MAERLETPPRPETTPPPAGEAEAENSERHLYESKLVEKLDNPELAGMRKFKDGVDGLALKTINKVENIAHTGRDAIGYVKRKRLKAKYNKNEKKREKYEAKAAKAQRGWLFKKRRHKKFTEKAAMYGRVAERKKKAIEGHDADVKQRHRDHETARTERGEAFDERHEVLLVRAQLATHRKMERRARRLERAEKYLPLDEQAKEMLQRRKNILMSPTNFGKLLAEVDAEIETERNERREV